VLYRVALRIGGHFSRIFGSNRMAIPAAAEFLFCRFRRFGEIVYFQSDRLIPASFLLEYLDLGTAV
jgi:hypothetical protein